ncbi:uncharacterized protein BDV17DRAFT_291927 [Aspergillus undulatus]|uniref:uncharacterized protein n=1 Tax=Aspergillus undulatus TaxID=1810928 RepID=UPI003CCDF3D5
MSTQSYAKRANQLKKQEPKRTMGSGSMEDPCVMWLCSPVDDPAGRVKTVEALCRQACLEKGMRKIWIRMGDHNTTQAFGLSVTDTRGAGVQKSFSRCDPHITVYMGNSYKYRYDGHIFVAYSKDSPELPVRFAEKKDRELIQPGEEGAICLLDRDFVRGLAESEGFL